MKLIIDAGGTSTKFVLLDNKTIISKFSKGPGNFVENFELAKLNVISGIDELLEKNKINKILIFAAGFEYLKITSKNELVNELKNKYGNIVEVLPDSLLPLFAVENKSIALTLGTGTSVVFGMGRDFEIYFGFGHLIGDPLSGYAIAQKAILSILSNGTDYEKSLLFKLFNVSNESEFITSIYQSTQKTYIANFAANVISNKVFEKHLIWALEKESEIFFSNKKVVTAFEQAKVILLNGSVAQQEVVKNILSRYTKAQLLNKPSDEEIYLKIADKM